jgi:L-alanine-DL-glutamate epimerase-like enolase superfamily enzyme
MRARRAGVAAMSSLAGPYSPSCISLSGRGVGIVAIPSGWRNTIVKITKADAFILHVPVTGDEIADSTHRISHWGAPGVILETDDGLRGYGYTGTHAHLPTDRLIADCIRYAYGPLLIGEDPREVVRLWDKLYRFPPVQWVGRGGIATLAHSAVDIALWDLKAKAADVPLWQLLGGAAKRLEAYNTDGGWLNWPLDRLIADSRRLVEEDGFPGIKIKVGSPQIARDLDRVEQVRNAIGPGARLMVDANGRWNLAAAAEFGRRANALILRGSRSRCGMTTSRGTRRWPAASMSRSHSANNCIASTTSVIL